MSTARDSSLMHTSFEQQLKTWVATRPSNKDEVGRHLQDLWMFLWEKMGTEPHVSNGPQTVKNLLLPVAPNVCQFVTTKRITIGGFPK